MRQGMIARRTAHTRTKSVPRIRLRPSVEERLHVASRGGVAIDFRTHVLLDKSFTIASGDDDASAISEDSMHINTTPTEQTLAATTAAQQALAELPTTTIPVDDESRIVRMSDKPDGDTLWLAYLADTDLLCRMPFVVEETPLNASAVFFREIHIHGAMNYVRAYHVVVYVMCGERAMYRLSPSVEIKKC